MHQYATLKTINTNGKSHLETWNKKSLKSLKYKAEVTEASLHKVIYRSKEGKVGNNLNKNNIWWKITVLHDWIQYICNVLYLVNFSRQHSGIWIVFLGYSVRVLVHHSLYLKSLWKKHSIFTGYFWRKITKLQTRSQRYFVVT